MLLLYFSIGEEDLRLWDFEKALLHLELPQHKIISGLLLFSGRENIISKYCKLITTYCFSLSTPSSVFSFPHTRLLPPNKATAPSQLFTSWDFDSTRLTSTSRTTVIKCMMFLDLKLIVNWEHYRETQHSTGQLGKKALQDNYINNASPLNFNQFFLRTARLNFLEWLLHGSIPHLKMIVLKCE